MADDDTGQSNRGLYGKFYVNRVDGQSGPNEKHEHCNYFVLDMNHDPNAIAAILAYAESCAETHPALSEDLKKLYG